MSSQRILLTKYIDHTNLNPTATKADIRKLCREAQEYDFKSVCVHPSKIYTCWEELKDSDILICTVVGFPLGQNTTASKVFETMDAIEEGANEIDMVINIAELKLGNKRYCVREINSVVEAAKGRLVKVIVETALLNEDEKRLAFEVVHESKAHYIKTSTGFSTAGAKIEDVQMWNDMKQDIGSTLKIKAAGGVTTYEDLLDFIAAGAERIGTSRSLSLFKGKDKLVTANIVSYVSIKGTTKVAPQSKIVDETPTKKQEVKEKESKETKETKEEVKEEKKVTKKGSKKASKEEPVTAPQPEPEPSKPTKGKKKKGSKDGGY